MPFLYEIGKTWKFEAAHRLQGLPAQHKCSNLHGHSYSAEVVISAKGLDQVGMVWDYRDLSTAVKPLIDMMDHAAILRRGDPLIAFLEREGSRVVVLETNPTAEVIARTMWEHVQRIMESVNEGCQEHEKILLQRITIRETEKTFATVGRAP